MFYNLLCYRILVSNDDSRWANPPFIQTDENYLSTNLGQNHISNEGGENSNISSQGDEGELSLNSSNNENNIDDNNNNRKRSLSFTAQISKSQVETKIISTIDSSSSK